jgi:peptide/nickel transport system substrate-binding protein
VRTRTRFGLCFLIIAVVFIGCAPPQGQGGGAAASGSQVTAGPKKLVAAIRGNPKFASSALNRGGGGRIDGDRELGGLSSVGLSVQSASGEYIAVLSEQLPTLENGRWKVLPDGRMETSYTIVSGAVWHDGTPYTAEDVAFSAKLSADSEMPWLPEAVLRYVEAVEAPDARTVRVLWKEPFIRPHLLDFNPSFPRHLLGTHYGGDKEAFLNLPYWTTEFVSNGPFKVKEFVRDSHVQLVAFDRYALGRPKLDEIEVRFIPDENALGANILAGTVQATLGPSVTVEQGIQIRDRWPEGTMRPGPSGWININPQFLNPDPPILLNVQFRRALYMAIDRQRIADELMYGLSDVAHSSIHPSEPEYKHIEPAIVRYEHDPRRSVQMIEELGYRKGGDGMFVDAAGKPLSIQIMATQDDANAKPQFAVLDYWKTIGITPDAEIVTSQRQRDLAYRANFRSFSLQAGIGYGPDGMNALLSKEARTPERNYFGGNYIRWMNADTDALVERYFTTIPFDQRMQVLGQLVRFSTDNVLWMPLYWRVLPTLTDNRVLEISPVGQGQQWWNAHLWDLK